MVTAHSRGPSRRRNHRAPVMYDCTCPMSLDHPQSPSKGSPGRRRILSIRSGSTVVTAESGPHHPRAACPLRSSHHLLREPTPRPEEDPRDHQVRERRPHSQAVRPAPGREAAGGARMVLEGVPSRERRGGARRLVGTGQRPLPHGHDLLEHGRVARQQRRDRPEDVRRRQLGALHRVRQAAAVPRRNPGAAQEPRLPAPSGAVDSRRPDRRGAARRHAALPRGPQSAGPRAAPGQERGAGRAALEAGTVDRSGGAMNAHRRILYACCLAALGAAAPPVSAQRTAKPVLHGRHWVAITGKPLGATAGAMMFQKGGNAVDAACAMLAAVTTMWDVLSWGGETQALIYDPHTGKVIGIDALGVAPTGATPEFFRSKGMAYPPEYGPLAAVIPGTPGGLMTMLAEYGTLSLKDVLEPAIQMADGYPIEAETANSIERNKERIKQWKYSRAVYLTHPGEKREAPYAGEVFHQPDLAVTLRKLVEAEQQALKNGKSRKEAIAAAYDRFYKGDIAREFVRGVQEEGGLITLDDLAGWKVRVEEPVMTTYRGIEVYKLTHWTQGPAMLQALNILENFDLKGMGFNSARYIHALYQAMNLAFADRDFYYGDPYFPPEEPIAGLLSKQYAKARAQAINWERNDPNA